MLFGVCATYDNAEFLKECGYDYIEMNLTATAGMSDAEFENCKLTLEKVGIKALAFNCFFPATIKLVGPEADLKEITDYTEKALERAALLGAKTIVLGSGRSRNINEGFDASVCEKQFVEVLNTLGDIAKKHGITIVIEPLNKGETNFINSVPDAIRIANLSSCDNVKALVDFYHFSLENEPDCDITNSNGAISHVHLARGSADRGVPKEENIPDLEKWADLLKKVGYNNKISIEASATDFRKEIKDVYKLLEIFNK